MRKKLTLIFMAISMAAVLLACILFITLASRIHRQSIVDDLTGLANLVGHNCEVALTFKIFDDATKMLSALEARPSVIYACIYDVNGDLFAQYRSTEAGGKMRRKMPGNQSLFKYTRGQEGPPNIGHP